MAIIYIIGRGATENYYRNRDGKINIQNIGQIAPLLTEEDRGRLVRVINANPTTDFRTLMENLHINYASAGISGPQAIHLQAAFGIVNGVVRTRADHKDMAMWWENFDHATKQSWKRSDGRVFKGNKMYWQLYYGWHITTPYDPQRDYASDSLRED